MKTSPFVAAALLVIAGAVIFEAVMVQRRRAELADLDARIAQLRSTSAQVQRRAETAAQRERAARATLAPLTQTPLEPDSQLERLATAWLARTARLEQLAAERADLGIAECEVLTRDQWLAAAREAELDSEDGIRAAFKSLHGTARESLARLLLRAVRAYADDHAGQLPDTPAALANFPGRPLSAALLERFELRQHGALDAAPRDEWILAERAALAQQRDDRIYVSAADSGTEDLNEISERALRLALRAYAAANAGQLPTEPAQLVTYFHDAPRPVALNAFLAQSKTDFNADKLRRLLPPK